MVTFPLLNLHASVEALSERSVGGGAVFDSPQFVSTAQTALFVTS